MKTIVYQLNAQNANNLKAIEHAAQIIKSGGLVAFPTETVYGLGANALSNDACAKVYAAKGRPTDNPLIMHIADMSALESIAKDIPPEAKKLMEHYWPGPLTIILNRAVDAYVNRDCDAFENVAFEKNVPRGTFLKTVAVRMPNNPIALELIHAAGVPIAAPSANISGRPSPTTAKHVLEDLEGLIDMVLDGGACEVGLESTVIDFTESVPIILRPGAITAEMVKGHIGDVKEHMQNEQLEGGQAPKSPGMKYKHYAPLAKLTIVTGDEQRVNKTINAALQNKSREKTGIMVMGNDDKYNWPNVLKMGNDADEVAANLFLMLRLCDDMGLDEVYVEGLEESGIGVAIMNRLKKAASYNII